MSGVVDVWCGGCLVWWMSGVVDVWSGECLVWWISYFTHGVVDVWYGVCPVCWMSGVVDVLFYTHCGGCLCVLKSCYHQYMALMHMCVCVCVLCGLVAVMDKAGLNTQPQQWYCINQHHHNHQKQFLTHVCDIFGLHKRFKEEKFGPQLRDEIFGRMK